MYNTVKDWDAARIKNNTLIITGKFSEKFVEDVL